MATENKNGFEWLNGFLWGLIPGLIIGAALYKHYIGL